MIYLDSCALVKLLLPEAETQALRAFLTARAGERHVTSALALTEVSRAAVRAGAGDVVLEAADRLLGDAVQLRLTEDLLRTAGRHPDPVLRSLDAIHLASAQSLGRALTAFVTYDKRLCVAAQGAGLRVASPGA